MELESDSLESMQGTAGNQTRRNQSTVHTVLVFSINHTSELSAFRAP